MLKNIVLILVVSFFAACNSSPSAGDSSGKNSSPANAGVQEGSGEDAGKNEPKERAENKTAKSFRGMINGTEFEMNLAREGENLSGTYFYPKVGKELKLSGKIDDAGKFTLEETDENGKKSGDWRGTWKDDRNSAGIVLEGDWKKPADSYDQSLGFYADEQIVEFTGDAKFITKTINEKDASKRSDIFAQYLEIDGVDEKSAAKFNSVIKDKVTGFTNSFKKQLSEYAAEDLKYSGETRNSENYISYNVVLANNDLASVVLSSYQFYGGAHGMTVYSSVNYDLKNNKELKLAELFEPDSDYVKAISDYSIAELKKTLGEMQNDELINDGAGAKAENFSNWNLTKKGLMFTFEPYQVAAYAAGTRIVIIPYEELKDILRKDGAAAPFVR